MRDLDLDARPRGTMRCGGGRSCDRGRASCSRLFHLDISSSSGDAGDARATARAAAAAPPTHPLARAPLPPLVGRRPGGGRVASPRRRRRSAGGGAGGRGSTLSAVNILLCPGSFSPPTPLHARLPLSPGVVSLCQSVHAYAHTNHDIHMVPMLHAPLSRRCNATPPPSRATLGLFASGWPITVPSGSGPQTLNRSFFA